MSKHHNDGTKISIDLILKKLKNEEYGPEVIDTIEWLIEQVQQKGKE
jgi:hypothetical protein